MIPSVLLLCVFLGEMPMISPTPMLDDYSDYSDGGVIFELSLLKDKLQNQSTKIDTLLEMGEILKTGQGENNQLLLDITNSAVVQLKEFCFPSNDSK